MGVDPLASWVTSKGGFVHERVHLLGDAGGKGRGVRATGDIDEGTLLLQLPDTCYISPASFPAAEGVGPFWRTVLGYVVDQHRPPHSRHLGPYSLYLPEVLTCVPAWPAKWRSALCRSLTLGQFADESRSAYDKILGVARQRIPTATMEDVKTAAWLVTSRAYHIEGNGPLLLPAVDMFNHSFSRSLAHVAIGLHNGAVVVQTCRPIRSGEEILSSYGTLGAPTLLHNYGIPPPKCSFPLTPAPLPVSCFPRRVRVQAAAMALATASPFSSPDVITISPDFHPLPDIVLDIGSLLSDDSSRGLQHMKAVLARAARLLLKKQRRRRGSKPPKSIASALRRVVRAEAHALAALHRAISNALRR
eukprot:Sspe_Gene.112007::Locus_94298_Transcript_1_1_Confidence_1.000_Length_1196::g.112007::m.112007